MATAPRLHARSRPRIQDVAHEAEGPGRPAVLHREPELRSWLDTSEWNAILGRVVEARRLGRLETQPREPFHLHRAEEAGSDQADRATMHRREWLAVEGEGDEASVQNVCHGEAVLEIRSLDPRGQMLALGCHVSDSSVDLDVVVAEDRRQRHAPEADVAHSAQAPRRPWDSGVLGAAVARALEHHLAIDLLHSTQGLGADDHALGRDESDQLDLPASERHGIERERRVQVLAVADEQGALVRDALSGEQLHWSLQNKRRSGENLQPRVDALDPSALAIFVRVAHRMPVRRPRLADREWIAVRPRRSLPVERCPPPTSGSTSVGARDLGQARRPVGIASPQHGQALGDELRGDDQRDRGELLAQAPRRPAARGPGRSRRSASRPRRAPAPVRPRRPRAGRPRGRRAPGARALRRGGRGAGRPR